MHIFVVTDGVRWPTTVTAKINTRGKRKLLTAKQKTSRQKEKDSRQKEKPHGKKKNTHGRRDKGLGVGGGRVFRSIPWEKNS